MAATPPRATGSTGRLLLKVALRASLQQEPCIVVVTHSRDYSRTLCKQLGGLLSETFGRHTVPHQTYLQFQFIKTRITFVPYAEFNKHGFPEGTPIFYDNSIECTQQYQ